MALDDGPAGPEAHGVQASRTDGLLRHPIPRATLGQLTILPSFSVWVAADGSVTLGKKFLRGMQAHVERWNGPVTVMLPSGPRATGLDPVQVELASLGFRLVIDGDIAHEISKSSVVLASAGREQAHVARWCERAGVPCAYVTENTLRTRLQGICASTRNPILRLRRSFWEWRTEAIMRRALRHSAGAQCNGTPTFGAYQALTQDPLLFFDTRSTAQSMATDAQLARRTRALLAGGPLRLLYSGRLVAIKGVQHLVDVARHLSAMGCDYEMSIAGDGDLAASIRRRAAGLPIGMLGVLDFETELQPLLATSVDLFVCCHRQGDPSCTYLETMAAGVPIVSYDNEAFMGIIEASGHAGWSVPMDQPRAMAAKIASLARSDIASAARKALAFARQHSLEEVFDRRSAHLVRLARGKR